TSAFLSDRQLGLRHRAAIGITEDSDAIALVVSEERGTVSIAHNGRIIRDLETERLEAILGAFFAQKSASSSMQRRWRQYRSTVSGHRSR
ncbi:MAG TPA: diadenylate cyclase, partial [Anaerolineae bacterium]|nr:diadenylate cyclase [Anaerolineae bacterium]